MVYFIQYLLIFIISSMIIAIVYFLIIKKITLKKETLSKPFSKKWRRFLTNNIEFYQNLNAKQRILFEQRIQYFLATKKISAVSTEIDDEIRLMVAASAIIPMFAFPDYNYPNLQEVLVYPNGFNEHFETDKDTNIIGMVGNQFMNGTMILSKPDLIRSYNLKNQKNNVGIHEFIHLIDKNDGAIDGVPDILIKNSYVTPWLKLVREEMIKIEKGKSDISPYALTNNAEFLAVVSEYFFDTPEKFKKEHPKLYEYLTLIFKQKL